MATFTDFVVAAGYVVAVAGAAVCVWSFRRTAKITRK